ncbi:MAG TPA: acyl-CoA reductase [Candidatus Saccharimonadales bacterium]|nr:acyl-CoA reductase [Candidatus Saccharimonadales bacterium]
MEPPNYFPADLPAEAELTAGLITEACQTLKRNRQRYLEGRKTAEIIGIIDVVAREWLSADFPFRKRVMELGPAATGFSAPVLAAGLDSFFKQLTAENLDAFLRQELGHPQRLDSFQADERQLMGKRTALARGPILLAQIAPGNIPNPALLGIVLGLLTRSAQFVKCASGAAFIPRLFAHSLYEADHKLGSCLEVAEWKGGNEPLEDALFAEADCISATGSDEMLASISRKIPRTARLVGYGTRVSFGYITREALDQNAEEVAHKAATDVTAWNQRGCLSPHVIYVEDSGKITAEAFAAMLAGRLDAVEKTHPRGTLPTQEAAAIAVRRSFYEVRAAHSLETKMWTSLASTAWTVILENDPRFQASCANRFIYVKGVPDLTCALRGAELVQDKVSTVGLAGTRDQALAMVQTLAHWGARRICPLGEMQNPPLGWRHDGRPPLGDLVTWIDWEKP